MIGDLHFHRGYSLRLQESKPLKNNGIIRVVGRVQAQKCVPLVFTGLYALGVRKKLTPSVSSPVALRGEVC
jgi:hypothetical protein